MTAATAKKTTTQTQHTPGPWKARDYAKKDGDIWIDCDSWRNPKTASCRGGTLATAHKNGEGEGNVVANARLMAAAPEMLEHAKWVCSLFGTTDPEGVKELREEVAALRTVIAKAEGR